MSKIALLPGGFKPPHAGHYNMAKWLSTNTGADTTIIFVGPKEREGITQAMSLKLWKLYTQNDSGLEVRPAGVSPVSDVYDFVEQDAPEGSTVYLGMGEKDINDARFKNIGKFADPKQITFKTVLVPPQAGGVSGTQMRKFITDEDKESFQKYSPDHIDKDKAWDIVNSLDEDLYDPNDHVLDYMKSSEWKAGMPDGHKEDDIEPGYKYRRGGMYTGGGMGFGGMYEDQQTQSGKKKLRVFDFDDTLAETKSKIKIKHSNGEIEILNSEEYAKYQGQPGDKFDFTDFDKVIREAEPLQHIIDLLKNDLDDPTNKVTILTARMMAYPVRRYLKTLGLDAYVVAVGGVDPALKAKWIADHIENKGYDDIVFIDDSEPNRRAIEALRDEYPGAKIEVYDPASLRENLKLNEATDDEISQALYSVDYNQLEPDEKERVQDVQDEMGDTLLNEFEDHEIKYWATHADLVKKLDAPDAEETYMRLRPELTGDRLKALDYFYHTYFKEDSPENLDEDIEDPNKLDLHYKKGFKDLTGLFNKITRLSDIEEIRKLSHVFVDNLKKASKIQRYKYKSQIQSGSKPQIFNLITNLYMKDSKMTSFEETKLFSQNWWKEQLTEVITETKANTHLTHLEELVLTQGQDGYNQAKSFLYELIKNLKGQDNSIKNVSVKWDGAPAIWAGINPDNAKFFVGTKSIFNKEPKINYTSQDIDRNHGHSPGLAKKLKLALQYVPAIGINGIFQGDFMFDSDDVDTQNIEETPHYTFKPNTIRYAVETNSEIGRKIQSAKIGIIWHTTYKDLSSESGASFGADISGLSKTPAVWFDNAYFKDDTGILLSDQEEKFILEKINEANSVKVDYTDLPLKVLNTYLNSEIRQGEFISDPTKSFENFKNWYQLVVNKSIEKVKRPETKQVKKQAGEDKIKEFESQKENIINVFKLSKLLSEAKAIFITKYDKAVATKHFIDNGDGTLRVTKAEGFVAVDHTENGIKLVDRLEFSRNNFNAGKPGEKK